MKNIFVGNLSFGVTEDAVRSLFEQYGTVERVSIVTDRDTGRAKGFGFVEMTGDADQRHARRVLERVASRCGEEHSREVCFST